MEVRLQLLKFGSEGTHERALWESETNLRVFGMPIKVLLLSLIASRKSARIRPCFCC